MENVKLNTMELPAIIMNDFIPFPHTEMRIDLTANLQIESLKVAEQYDNMVVLLFLIMKLVKENTWKLRHLQEYY